ncbi:uncharacterized protein LOC116213366 [Punica granatum]|uniref:Uncharacterized protein LOC116213366 n=2 Tax=Punica granatum TaxID=22663 RepID=A0A6P8EA34_PUNGR|nr:uncharacterized protein LOC116213366 [Punica granatum]PKI63309.1 hypothetical protein CRG98_016300 [Punica granatum]
MTALLLLLAVGSAATLSSADLYGNPSPPPPPAVSAPPPPSAVAGKKFPQQFMACNDPTTTCYGKNITCPQQCPSFKPADPTAKACTIDCSTPTCEAYCKNRTANCNGVGSACGDPRFVGGDGIVFYFHGQTNQYFSLVSDRNLQINARFIGRHPEGRKRDNTWIQALGVMFGRHTFTLAANKVAKWDNSIDQLQFTYDGEPVHVGEGHLASWTAADSDLSLERTAHCNSITLTLPGVAEVSANVVPITKEDDRIHNYQIPEDDCFAHLEVQFQFFDLSEMVEGVLGQTYRPDFASPVKRGVAMPIMGGENKYRTSSLVSADCSYCNFSPELRGKVTALSLEPTNVMECTSKMSDGHGVICRR